MIGKALRNATQGGSRRRYSQYEVGALTTAMGLELRTGDPAFNLLIDAPNRMTDIAGGGRAAVKESIDILADGAVDGRPVQFVWRDDASSKRGVLGKTITYALDARISMPASSAVAPFEILHATGGTDKVKRLRRPRNLSSSETAALGLASPVGG